MSEIIETTPTGNQSGTGMLARGAMLTVGAVALSALTARPAAAALVPAPQLTFAQIPGAGNFKVLNFALAYEALESSAYRQAVVRLTTGGVLESGKTATGLGLSSNRPSVAQISLFRSVETQHRDFLTFQLGTNAITDPTNGILRNIVYDFGIDQLDEIGIVNLLRTLCSIGVSAYLGGIKFFANRDYLLVSGSLQAVEARQTATLTIISNQLSGQTNPTAPLRGQNTTTPGIQSLAINSQIPTVNTLGATQQAGIDGTLEPDQVLALAAPYMFVNQ